MDNCIASVRGTAHCTLRRANSVEVSKTYGGARYDSRKKNIVSAGTTSAKIVKSSEDVEHVV